MGTGSSWQSQLRHAQRLVAAKAPTRLAHGPAADQRGEIRSCGEISVVMCGAFFSHFSMQDVVFVYVFMYVNMILDVVKLTAISNGHQCLHYARSYLALVTISLTVL